MNEVIVGWEVRSLGSIAEYVNGFPFSPSQLGEAGTPVIRIEQLNKPDGRYDYTFAEAPERSHIHNGDLIFSWSGTLKVARWKHGPGYLNQHLFKVTPKKGIDSEFLRHSIEFALDELIKAAHGSTMKHIQRGELDRHIIQIPASVTEQRSIAEVLSVLDEQIEQTEILIEKFEVTRTGLVRKLLAEVEASPRLPLKQVADIGSGVTLGREFTGAGIAEYPYLRVANVQDGRIDLTEVKTIRIPIVSAAKAMLQAGDVLMNEGGDFDKLGRGAVWSGQIPHCLHQNHVFRVRCDKSQLLPGFLALWAASDFGKRFFILASKQSTNLASINSTQLKNFPILKPSIEKQQEILDAVEGIDAIQKTNKAEIGKLRLQKQGLMRDLLTGNTRIQ